MRSEVGLVTPPPGQPAIGRGDGKGETAEPPDTMRRLASRNPAYQCQKLLAGDTGMADEMAPEDGEGPPASPVVAAAGAKKRIRLISR